MKIRIFTDTSADCLEQEIKQLGIEIIELPVTFDGELEPCRNNELFWKTLLSGKLARTSQPSPEILRNVFADAKSKGDALIYISISSKMSGTYENALAIKNEIGYDNIYIVDSLNATTAQKVLVLEACKLRDAGKEALDIVDRVNELKHRIRLFACIDTLKYLARGGRISKTSAAIGTLMNLKPFITFVDGEVRSTGKTVGTTLAIHKLADKLKEFDIDFDYAPIPLYSHDSKNTLSFVKYAKEKGFAFDENLLTPIGATIGTHIGPGGFGIVFVVK